jgi:hypothetical protein
MVLAGSPRPGAAGVLEAPPRHCRRVAGCEDGLDPVVEIRWWGIAKDDRVPDAIEAEPLGRERTRRLCEEILRLTKCEPGGLFGGKASHSIIELRR